MSKTTVPADLLPGLARKGAAVVVNGQPGVISNDGDHPLLDVWLEEDGETVRAPDEMLVDITEPTGWDAAVDCLARGFWPGMEETERAVFYCEAGVWRLDPPLSIRDKREGAWMYWGSDMPPPWEPHEALRLVLEREAKRRAAGTAPTPSPP